LPGHQRVYARLRRAMPGNDAWWKARAISAFAMVDDNPELIPAPAPSSRVLTYVTALTCGVLAALALEIYLSRIGLDLVAAWKSLFSTRSMQLRTAGPWWAIAGLAFIAGGAVAAALSRAPPPWRRFRLLRWIAGALIVWLLAEIGGSASSATAATAGAHVAANLSAMTAAALMALCGAYFTVRR
jgi:hypothetical protein